MNKTKGINVHDYNAKLKLFFQTKKSHDKINRDLKRHKKVSKRHKILTFDHDQKQFRLVDKNNVAVVSVSRIAKKNVEELVSKNKIKIEKNKKSILKTKYQLLFEYNDIEKYGNIYKDSIEPREESNHKYQKNIDQFENKKKHKIQEYEQSRRNILNQQEPFVIELNSEKGRSENINKAENMQSYIEYQSELYELSREYHLNSLIIDETAVEPTLV